MFLTHLAIMWRTANNLVPLLQLVDDVCLPNGNNQVEPVPWQIIDQILSSENAKNLEPSIRDELENKVNEYMDELEKIDEVLVQRKNMTNQPIFGI